MALGLALAAGVWLAAAWPPPVWWRDHWPRETAMMAWTRTAEPRYHPTPLADISAHLQRMVILAEDSRFRSHCGVDLAELKHAAGVPPDAGVWETVRGVWRGRDRIRGASTITQQLAKNLYLSPSRSPLRKLKEAATALRLELALSKDRILELYLNVAEWGPGIWGADRASREYFGVPPDRLGLWEAASLAATLPHPRTSNPTYRPERMAQRRALILARHYGADVVIPPSDLLRDLPEIRIEPPPVVIPPALESHYVDSRVITDTPDKTHRRTHAQRGPGVGAQFQPGPHHLFAALRLCVCTSSLPV
ncbi:MAG: biosynthetic peptidoglycan transglycosylase [Gemmatimonadales bacterium]